MQTIFLSRPNEPRTKFLAVVGLMLRREWYFNLVWTFVLAKNGQNWSSVQKLDNVNDMINKTMFAKAESPSYHRKQYVNRESDRCGVDKLDLLNGEKDVRSNVPLETWQTT